MEEIPTKYNFEDLSDEKDEINRKCEDIVDDIKSSRITVVNLIEHLQCLLVNISPSKREVGVHILTNVLECLPKEFFTSDQLEFLCIFYADRLKDNSQIIPGTLRGILALTKFSQFPIGASTQILTALFHNVGCQQQKQPDRSTIYHIIKYMVYNRASDLHSMGLEFVNGFISTVDGERDPRNLQFVFSWIPKLLETVILGHFEEDMFEVLACYFPIDFKTPPREENTVTREGLSSSLCLCLTSIPEFGEHCLQLALEKLDTSLEIAKIDSLKLLREGCRTFEVATYLKHASEIWSKIQKELLNCTDENLEKECLGTLESVIKKLSKGPDLTFEAVLKDITDTIKGNLWSNSKMFLPTSKLLQSVSLTDKSSRFVIKEIMPLLTNTFTISKDIKHKCELLELMARTVTNFTICNDEEIEEMKYVPVLALKAIVDPDANLRRTGFDCMGVMVNFLPGDVRNSLYVNLSELVANPQSSNERKSMIACLETLLFVYGPQVCELVLRKVEPKDLDSLQLFLSVLCQVYNVDCAKPVIIEKLLQYCFKDANWTKVALNHLSSVFKMYGKDVVGNYCKLLIAHNFIHDLISYAFSVEYVDNHRDLLDNIRIILRSLIQYQDKLVQQQIVDEYFPKIQQMKHDEIYIILLDGLLTTLHREIAWQNKSVIIHLIAVAIPCKDTFIYNISAQLLANLINKHPTGEDLDNNLLKIKQCCFDDLQASSTSAIGVLAWVTKALFTRNHTQSIEWSNFLVDLLDQQFDMSNAFRIIMNDDYASLSSESNCNRAILYRQKFFTVVTNRLSQAYTGEKTLYLVAIGSLLEFAPQQAVLLQFKKISKLVLQSLGQCQEPDVLSGVLRVLKELITSNQEVLMDLLEDFLLRVLQLALFQPSMKVRIKALKVLQLYPDKYPIYKLLPHKTAVLQTLGQCLDDKKRIVRQEAVQARCLWFLLDAPL